MSNGVFSITKVSIFGVWEIELMEVYFCELEI